MTSTDPIVENNIRSKTDYELYMMINFDTDQYTSSSLAIAKHEYNSRRIEKSQEIIFEGELKTHLEDIENRKNVGASFIEKCLCFFFPGLILFMALENLRVKGYEKKAKDLNTATKLGITFYVLLIIISSL